MTVRRATAADGEFLWEMLAEAVFGGGFDVAAVRREPALSHYLDDFDIGADERIEVALIAERAGEPIGAAWYRRFTAADPGYGFVDDETPELPMACVAAARGVGVGGLLLDELLAVAAAAGLPALSLSVALANDVAVRLYERRGFVAVGAPAGGSITMVRPP